MSGEDVFCVKNDQFLSGICDVLYLVNVKVFVVICFFCGLKVGWLCYGNGLMVVLYLGCMVLVQEELKWVFFVVLEIGVKI